MVPNPVQRIRSWPAPQGQHAEVLIIGSGIGALSAAAILAQRGISVRVIEQNYLPGGCASSYWRKGAVFESGATTLVGLGDGMPLQTVLNEAGLRLDAEFLDLPMEVHLATGQRLRRFSDSQAWISEISQVLGGGEAQQAFWEQSLQLSRFVWQVAQRYPFFPWRGWKDAFQTLKHFQLRDAWHARHVFETTAHALKRFGLKHREGMLPFVNEQLRITAQNTASEVSYLFGAAALCYTMVPNAVLRGGMIRLAETLCEGILHHGGQLHFQERVQGLRRHSALWHIQTSEGSYTANRVISGIPAENLLQLLEPGQSGAHTLKQKLCAETQLSSALQLNLLLPETAWVGGALHHQVHWPHSDGSVFISRSLAGDALRAPEGMFVASVTTHAQGTEWDRGRLQQWAVAVLDLLRKRNILNAEPIAYQHVSGPQEWEHWTGRFKGFVGGYPQRKSVFPWNMIGHELGEGLYLCGDTAYPGQGIPGVALSGRSVAMRISRAMGRLG